MGRVSGSTTVRAASTSATLSSSWNCARGFMLPWNEFFAATMAKCSLVLPYFFMCFFAITA